MRSASVLSLSSLSSLLRAVVTAKVLAVALGPSQVGILSQLLNFSAFLFTILPLGLTSGVSKMVAEEHADHSAVDRVVGTSAVISLVSGAGAAVLLAPFAGQISVALTGTPRYAIPVLLILASFPLYNLAGVLGYVLQGLADIRRLTWANVGAAALSLVPLVPLTFAFGLTGAIVAVLITSVTQSALFVAAVWRSYAGRLWRLSGIRISRSTASSLIAYGGVMILAGAAQWGSLLLVRTFVVRDLGDYENGIYQVAYGFSSQYMTVFMTWMGAYVFPRIAAERDRTAIPTLLNSGLRANLFLMVPGLVGAIVFRDPLIRIFYSGAFLAASSLMPIQALGDLARVIGWSYGVSLFGQGHTRAFLVTQIVQAAAWVVLAVLLVPRLGTLGAAVSYSLSFLTWPLLMLPMAHRLLGSRLDREAVVLITAGVVSVAAAILMPRPYGLVAAPLVPALVYLNRRRLARA